MEGKQLHPAIREIFAKSGSYNGAVRAIIDMIQAHIDQRKMMKFGYRSASWKNRSDYNPFFERSVTPYGWQISPKKARNYMGRTIYPNLKVVAYDADLIMNNVERLAHAGFIKKPQEFLESFQQVAQDVLQPDGEGRINPQGLGENELMVAAMGMKESYENIQNPKLQSGYPIQKINYRTVLSLMMLASLLGYLPRTKMVSLLTTGMPSITICQHLQAKGTGTVRSNQTEGNGLPS